MNVNKNLIFSCLPHVFFSCLTHLLVLIWQLRILYLRIKKFTWCPERSMGRKQMV